MTCKVCCKSGYIKQKLFSIYIYIYIYNRNNGFLERKYYLYIYIYRLIIEYF